MKEQSLLSISLPISKFILNR